jgi:C1A family cysteine protease
MSEGLEAPRKFYMGCKKSQLDGSEKQYHEYFRSRDLVELPTKVDLRDSGFVPPILNQLSLGSCVHNATSNALLFLMNKEGLENPYQPSRLFLYYFTRFLEDTIEEDGGSEIHNAMKTVFAFGVCSEEDWAYDITKFTEKPPLKAIKKARKHLDNFEYYLVKQDLNIMKQVLVDGNPIIFGLTLFESYMYDETLKTGKVPIPKITEQIIGGHAQNIVGFNDETQEFLVEGSWGTEVADKGYFYIPYDYILNPVFCMDCWCLKQFK